MQYALVLEVPDELAERVVWLHDSLDSQGLLRRRRSSPPHITLRGSAGLVDSVNWLADTVDVLKSWTVFEVTMGGPVVFPDWSLVLAAHSDDAQRLRAALVASAMARGFEVDPLEPPGGGYNLHTTVAKLRSDLAGEEVTRVGLEAYAAFAPYPTFVCDRLMVLARPSQNVDWAWAGAITFGNTELIGFEDQPT